MRSTKVVFTADLIQTLTNPRAHTVIPSVDGLWKSRPVDKSSKRCTNSWRGLALFALRLSGELKKSTLGENCLHDSRRLDYYNDDKRAARPDVGNKPLSNLTNGAVDAPNCPTRIRSELDELPLCLFQLGHRLTFFRIRWALQSCQGE